jgi:hypothetical protein
MTTQVRPGHDIICCLDAAYTRNVTERFDGLRHPDDDDEVPTVVNVWAETNIGILGVDLTVPDAGIRVNLTVDQAEELGCALIAEAARARREAWS